MWKKLKVVSIEIACKTRVAEKFIEELIKNEYVKENSVMVLHASYRAPFLHEERIIRRSVDPNKLKEIETEKEDENTNCLSKTVDLGIYNIPEEWIKE